MKKRMVGEIESSSFYEEAEDYQDKEVHQLNYEDKEV